MAESFGVFGMACFARAAAFPAPFIFAYKMATSRDDKKTLVNTRPHTGEPDLTQGTLGTTGARTTTSFSTCETDRLEK